MPARYRVDPVRPRPFPKPGGGVRLLAELTPRDTAAWERLGRLAARLVEPRLSGGVLAERLRPAPDRWLRPSLDAALRRARSLACRFATGSEVVSADVRACYASMDPSVVAVALAAAGAPRGDSALAADMLEGWGSEGYAGLPIGPPASAAVANAVLLRVDRGLGATPFLRWVDDYLLPAGLLDRLDEGLDAVGLERSIEKTVEGRAGVWLGGPEPYPPIPGTR